MPRSADNLSRKDAKAFRDWLERTEKRHWPERGSSMVDHLVSDGEIIYGSRKLPARAKDWYMRVRNRRRNLSRAQAIELLLRLRRYRGTDGRPIKNENMVRLLIDTTGDPLVIIPSGEAKYLHQKILRELERWPGTKITENAKGALLRYLARFENIEKLRGLNSSLKLVVGGAKHLEDLQEDRLRAAIAHDLKMIGEGSSQVIRKAEQAARQFGRWGIVRATVDDDGGVTSMPDLYARLEEETSHMKFEERKG